jgi:4-hydroxy-2-oxoheptanedioate aldolase
MSAASGSTRAALRSGDLLFGAWLQLPSPLVAEALGGLGFDWIGIDTQHGLIGYTELRSMLQALSISSTPAIVRVSANDAAEIGRALDAGAGGVIVPLVETAEAAAAAVAACRYAPEGRRSWGPIRPVMADPAHGPRDGDAQVACVVMIETRRGVENADEITAVPGVDGVLIGPSDLAVSLGRDPTPLLSDEDSAPYVRRVVEACRSRDIAVGGLAPTPGHVADFAEVGCRFIAVYRDIQGMTGAAAGALRSARSATGRGDRPGR